MQIPVVSAIGQGRTPLSAFDDALRRCGVHNFNLIALSSVIPPRSEVVMPERGWTAAGAHGDRLYVVKAEARSAEPGAVVGAGIGWYRWGDGRGVFVEHESVGADCRDVQAELLASIQASLRDLCAFREVELDPARLGSRIAVGRVERRPASALVLAVYETEGW